MPLNLAGMCISGGLVLLVVCGHSWACRWHWERVGYILMMSPHHARCKANNLSLTAKHVGPRSQLCAPWPH